jgi:hypothetical protein
VIGCWISILCFPLHPSVSSVHEWQKLVKVTSSDISGTQLLFYLFSWPV